MMDSNGLDAASGLYGKKLLGTHVCTQQCFGSLGLAIQIEALNPAWPSGDGNLVAQHSETAEEGCSCDYGDFTEALEVGKVMEGSLLKLFPEFGHDMMVYFYIFG